MISFRHRGPLAATALLIFSAGAATADVTPDQVWAAIQGQMTAMGYTPKVETLSDTPDSLVLGDVTYSIDMPEGGTVQIVARGMRFDADGKGGVEADFSHTTMAVAIADPGGQQVEAELALSTAGQTVHYGGTPEKLVSTYDWPLASLSLTALRVDGKPIDATGTVTLHDLKGTYTLNAAQGDTKATTDSDMTISRIDLAGEGNMPDQEPSHVKVDGSLLDIAANGSGQSVDLAVGGLPTAGTSHVSYGAGDLTLAADGHEGDGTLELKVSSGFLESAVEAGHLIYGTGGSGFEVAVGGNMVPFAGTVFKLATSQSHLDLPLQGSEDPQHFGLSFSLDGAELADQVWGMFDPQATLSRDPATVSLNLSGDAVLKQGLAEILANPQAVQSAPGDLRALVLDGLVLRALGAELTAAGSAKFANGSPMPVGSLDVHAKNITTVLQKLSTLGLVDPGSAGMAQMMLGMYAKPGDGPDTWDSHVEMTEQGGLLVNGQPMQ